MVHLFPPPTLNIPNLNNMVWLDCVLGLAAQLVFINLEFSNRCSKLNNNVESFFSLQSHGNVASASIVTF